MEKMGEEARGPRQKVLGGAMGGTGGDSFQPSL